MPNLKEVRGRISSVISTQQITKAMKLVSATKLRRAQSAIVQMRPYAEKLKSILVNVAGSVDDASMSPYFAEREVNKVLLVVITSDRGLCGAFNANVIKLALRTISEQFAEQKRKGGLEILPIGKKAYEFFTRAGYKVNPEHRELFLRLNAENAFESAGAILQGFATGSYDEVQLVYNQFKNAATQVLTAERFLPVDLASFQSASETAASSDYIFEPGKAEILTNLIPTSLKTQFYRALLDSFAAEHGARMVAMDKATDNAGELLKSLRLSYNQARQAAITNEISEIVGGAAALNG